jgi:hypothetical protein
VRESSTVAAPPTPRRISGRCSRQHRPIPAARAAHADDAHLAWPRGDAFDSRGAALSQYNVGRAPSTERNAQMQARIEVQIAPTTSISIAALIALLMSAVCWTLYYATPGQLYPAGSDGGILTAIQILALAPGALMGAVAYRDDAIGTVLSRGPRRLALALAVVSAPLGLTLALRWGAAHAVEYFGGLLATWGAGVFAICRLSRRYYSANCNDLRKTAERLSPDRLRHRQRRLATILLVATFLGTAFLGCFPLLVLHLGR